MAPLLQSTSIPTLCCGTGGCPWVVYIEPWNPCISVMAIVNLCYWGTIRILVCH